MTEEDKRLVYELAQQLTGAHPEGTYQIGIFITNVNRRMMETGHRRVAEYLDFAKANPEEHGHLLSALSIHTTSWFRENPHYVILQKELLARSFSAPYRAWSCACSTGEEVYSLALLLEEFRRFHPKFDYDVLGTDIDPISLDHARRAIYEKRHLTGPVSFYKKHVLLGSDATEGYFTFSPEVRKRCAFKNLDIRSLTGRGDNYDLILCRNVLIYFQSRQVEDVIQRLLNQLNPGGHLILGHSEMIDYQKFGLSLRGHSVYGKAADYESSGRSAAQILKPYAPDFNPRVIAIGASTGGPEALSRVLRRMPSNVPPVIVAQHIAGDFSRGFGERLAQVAGLRLGSFADLTPLENGHLYCADAEHHLAVERAAGQLFLRQERRPSINGHRPSVDHLFQSLLPLASDCLAILLSGMGRDGAEGLRDLHARASYTCAQSADDCVVYGMPKEAVALGAVDVIGSADQIHDILTEIIERQSTSNN